MISNEYDADTRPIFVILGLRTYIIMLDFFGERAPRSVCADIPFLHENVVHNNKDK